MLKLRLIQRERLPLSPRIHQRLDRLHHSRLRRFPRPSWPPGNHDPTDIQRIRQHKQFRMRVQQRLVRSRMYRLLFRKRMSGFIRIPFPAVFGRGHVGTKYIVDV